MANMTFKANLIPASNTVLELGKSGSDNANYWNNVYAKTVTLSQDPINNLEAATKQYVDNKLKENTPFKIPVSYNPSAAGYYLSDSSITAQEIYDNSENCVINSSDYGFVETTCFKTSSNVTILGKAYYNIGAYDIADFILFEIVATPSSNKINIYGKQGNESINNDIHLYGKDTSTYNRPLLVGSIFDTSLNSSLGFAGYNPNVYLTPSTGTITATTFNGNATTATTATKLGTANKGSGTKPIYLAAGVPNECSTYAGGTAVTLNGSSKAASTASFYAPITSGTAGQVLQSNGSGAAPTWVAATAASDTLVKQTVKSDNVNYKLLMGANSSPTSGTAYEAVYDTAITVNPSTDTITATNFAGNATTATTATNLANAPSLTASGNNITITAGGKTSSAFTVPYATSAGVLNYGSSVTTDDAINNFLEASKLKVALWTSTSSPGQNNGILISGAYSSTSYGFQLAIDDDPTYYMALRQKGSSSGWSAWKQIPMGDGTGASGTWGISIKRNAINSSWLSGRANALAYLDTADGYSTLASIKTTNGTWSIGHYTSWADSLLWIYLADSRTENNYDARAYLTSAGEYHASKVWGAVYNDYAEMRNVPAAQNGDNPLKPGTCVREVGDGTMVATTERLQRGCKIISDTFGFNIGETDDCKTPIAVSGRALVYLDQDREIARDYIGWPVCSGPNGTVSIMTEEEEEKYPSRIVGTISEIPDYEKWGSSNVEVNGRIWIYVK